MESPGRKVSGGDTLAVSSANVGISHGEFVAIVGPSGCASRPCLKLIAGLTKPSRGSVRVDGEGVLHPLKTVGMAFQNATLLPWRNIRDNVMLPLEIVERIEADRSRTARRTVTAPRPCWPRWDCPDSPIGCLGSCPAACSSERNSAAPDPRTLDTSARRAVRAALDTFTREELWGVLQELWSFRKCTIILVTHELREAVFLADTVHVMSSRPGQIIQSRSVDPAAAADARFDVRAGFR